MRVGVTGHQKRDGIDWEWTREAVTKELCRLASPLEGWSSLAIGADQLFARAVLDLGGSIVTVVPGEWYETFFDGDGLERYRALLTAGRRIELEGLEGEDAFLAAGLEVADSTDALLAIWDGKRAQGRGGTADIVDHARTRGKNVMHVNPIERTVVALMGIASHQTPEA
jgi:hypothetical protein